MASKKTPPRKAHSSKTAHASAPGLGAYEAFLSALVGGGPDFAIEKRYIRSGGGAVKVPERVSASRDADGNVTTIVAVAFDDGREEA